MMGRRHDDIELRIATIKKGDRGHSQNMKTTWGELREKLATPAVDTKHTLPQYLDLHIDQQNKLKDVGSFVGGPFRDGLRKKNSLKYRSVLTLDIDSATAEHIDFLKEGLSDVCKYEFFGSTTRKHTKKKPRWRLVFPLKRPVTIDEYAPLSRIVAATVFETVDESMDAIDDVSHRPAQVMYWPSVCKDALFDEIHNEGKILNPDKVLEAFGDWQDWSLLPFSKKRGQKRPSADKAEVPTTKSGFIGAFCRAYSIEEAIDAFLPDIYELGDEDSSKPRYTYIHGSSSNGAVVEDDGLFLYSHHGTDPCAEQLVNAFDMVRIHLFGEMDMDAPDGASPTELPSFKAMIKMLRDDEATCDELDDDYQDRPDAEFSDIEDEEDDEKPRKKDKKPKKTAESHDDDADDEDEPKKKKKSGPDLSILRQSTLEAPEFPLDTLGPFWADRVRYWSKAKSAPVDYPAIALLVGAASLIGNSRRVAVHSSWVEPCILWGAVVGTPSSKKSPALDSISNIITEIEKDWIAPHTEAIRDWEAEKRVAEKKRKIWEAKMDEQLNALDNGTIEELDEEFMTMPSECAVPARPVPRRARISDTTMEAMLYNLAGNPRGFMAQRDELSAWYASFTRYAGSGSSSDRAMWLEAFGGRPMTIDRVKHIDKPVSVPSFAVSLLGGIQPDKLTDFMKSADDGLQARFLYAWPEPSPVRYTLMETEDNGAEVSLKMLADLDMEIENGFPKPEVLPMSEKARTAFLRWSEDRTDREQFEMGMAGGAFGKAEGIVARLALVLEHLWWCADMFGLESEPNRVSLRAVKAAIRLREEYFKPMQLRVFNHGGSGLRGDTQSIVAWIINKEIETVTVRDVCRSAPGIQNRDPMAVSTALEDLVEAGWLVAADVDTGSKGRRTRKYKVNPKAIETALAA